MFERLLMAGVACAAFASAACAQAAPAPPPHATARAQAPRDGEATRPRKPALDRSGRTRIGTASFYGAKFSGRKMADGTRMDPRADGAASKTLPLGTTAKVTNLETGESAVVTIRDRGPHVRGRIVDLSPATARKVGIDRQDGVSKVAVTPLSLPPPDDRAGPDAPSTGAQAARPDRARMPRSTPK